MLKNKSQDKTKSFKDNRKEKRQKQKKEASICSCKI
jgi:hypothetical protein